METKKTSEIENEYWKRVCEADAEWDFYCKHPTDQTYKNWVNAKKAEKQAELLWANEIGI